MKQQYSAGVVLFKMNNSEPHFLLLQYLSGHWGLAKGKIEGGETKHQAALRELHEETGLTAEIIPGLEKRFEYQFYDQTKTFVKKTVYFFVAQAHEGEVKLSREHTDFVWVPFNDAIVKVTHDNVRNVLYAAKDFIEKSK